jgi:hypothetical protein
MTHENKGEANGSASIEIVRLRRISQSQPTAWEGRTAENAKAHIAYRYGVLSVSLWHSCPEHGARWGIWDEIIRLKPLEMMAEIHLLKEFGESRRTERGLLLHQRQLRMECENRVMAEIRSDVWPRKDRPARIVHVRELWEWLEAREKYFEILQRRGLAGGRARVRVSALTDG